MSDPIDLAGATRLEPATSSETGRGSVFTFNNSDGCGGIRNSFGHNTFWLRRPATIRTFGSINAELVVGVDSRVRILGDYQNDNFKRTTTPNRRHRTPRTCWTFCAKENIRRTKGLSWNLAEEGNMRNKRLVGFAIELMQASMNEMPCEEPV
jgi:hypothetical protein